MPAVALRQRAIRSIDLLDDEQTLNVITYIETLPKVRRPMQNSKTPKERELAKKALDELFAMARPAKHQISLNGEKEVAEVVMRKYESLG